MRAVWIIPLIASILILGTLGIQEAFAGITFISTCQLLDKPGETYVLTADNLFSMSCFSIRADNITLDGNGHTISGSPFIKGSDFGVLIIDSTGVTIKNLNVENFPVGTLLFRSDGNTLTGNTLTNVGFSQLVGIELILSNDNTITGNTIQKDQDGFRILSSSVGNHINDNLITDNEHGIHVCRTLMHPDNSLFPNQFRGAQQAIFVDKSC